MISDYYMLCYYDISYDILRIPLISNLPLKKAWPAVLLFPSSEFHLTAEEMEPELLPQNLWHVEYQKDGFGFGAAIQQHQQTREWALLQKGSRQSI